MKLISMRLYLLWIRGMTTKELADEIPNVFSHINYRGSTDSAVLDFLANDAKKWDLAGEYTKLLSKKVTRGMFIPCDLEGNFLIEPANYDNFLFHKNDEAIKDNRVKFPKSKEYHQAKERVLFDGDFEFLTDEYIRINGWTVFNTGGGFHSFEIVEDLVEVGLELTPSTIKQLRL